MTQQMTKLIAAASQTSGATSDIIEAIAAGEIRPFDNVGAGDTLVILADGMRLLIEGMGCSDETGFDEDANQLHGALVRFLDSRS